VDERIGGEQAAAPTLAGHFIVCGLGRFGLCVIEQLRAAGRTVVVITSPATRADRKQHASALGARVLEGDFRFHDVLERAGLDSAHALLFVSSNNAANLETALDVKRIAPRVRLVLRLDQDKLAERLRRDFGIERFCRPPCWLPVSSRARPVTSRRPTTDARGTGRPGCRPALPCGAWVCGGAFSRCRSRRAFCLLCSCFSPGA
jgi:hypothetical protein